MATLHRAPRAVRPGTTVGRYAHLSLVIPSDAVRHSTAAALGEVSGQAGAADAGVC
ncbi:MAG TPA: hypothetical protein VFX16_05260 [Pseudonocardiaceae bacterium]|nr:hypothetical protein [Pseudonocardiaceae bacterium]